MKLGILTQPLFTNYGGILQAYALQSVLQSMGHEVKIIRRDPKYLSIRFPNSILLDIKYYICKLLRRKSGAKSAQQIKYVSSQTSRFINKYINITESLYTENQLNKYIANNQYDGFIVGSDQVWRPAMSPNIYNFFLDFLKHDPARRVAYAASFGVDNWEFTEEQTQICRQLAKRFDAISVREESGVYLCKKYLGVNAAHVLDPTLLLSEEEYTSLVIAENELKLNGDLFCYVLDMTKDTMACIATIKSSMDYSDYYCMPDYKDTPYNIEKYKHLCVFPPVTQWIRSFMDAKMVFTDSFHGTVFSIIFHKPFWVIGNKNRGLSRIESLLKIFGLQDRLITIDDVSNTDWSKQINWKEVNQKRNLLKELSISYICNALKH